MFGRYYLGLIFRYVLGLTCARFILFSQGSIDQGCLQKICDFMKQFLLQFKPSVVTQLEERYQYNWITMRPFVDPLYSCSITTAKLSDTALQKSHCSETFTEERNALPTTPSTSLMTALSVAYLLFALKVETARKVNTELLVTQGFLEYITMLQWGLDDGWCTQCQWVQEEIRRASHSKLPVPRLSSIARAKLARTNMKYSGQI